MPKVKYQSSKGLTQESGSGQEHQLAVNNTTDTWAVTAANSSKLEYRIIQENITLGDSSTTTTGAASFVPAGMIVLGGEVRIATAGAGANAAPTSIGDGSDVDYYGAFTLNATSDAGTSVVLIPTVITPKASAQQLTVTHSSVTQSTDAILTVTLFGLIPVKGT